MKQQPAKKTPKKPAAASPALPAPVPPAPPAAAAAPVAPHLITVGGKTMTVAEWTFATAGKVPDSLRIPPHFLVAAHTVPPVTPNAPPAPAPPPALKMRDIDAVFDTLVIGGCPRAKSWVMSFLKASGHRHERGAMLSPAEVTHALQQLAAA